MRSYGTKVVFDSPLYFDSLGYDSIVSNTKVYLFRPYMDGVIIEGWWWIRAESGNVTINDFYVDNLLRFSWVGSGSGLVQFSTGTGWGKPSYVSIDGLTHMEGDQWTYDGDTDSVTISTPLSTHAVIVSWIAAPSEPSSGQSGESGYVPPIPVVSPIPVIPPFTLPDVYLPIPSENLAVLVIVLGIIGVGIVSWFQNRKGLSKKWAKNRSSSKKAEGWKRKKRRQ